jgi:alkylated DNA nucleotide flippase Atl1
MSLHGSGVPWWRVVRADGRPVRGLEKPALELLRRDGTPLQDGRVDMRAARVRRSTDPDAGLYPLA